MASGPIFPAVWQMPVDYIVRKSLPGISRSEITVHDAYGNLRFRVCTHAVASSHMRAKTLFDAVGNPLITCVRHQGEWQGFSGNSWECKDVLFTAQKTTYSPFDTELQVCLLNGNTGQPSLGFKVKGSTFQRSCNIYGRDSIIAQTNPNYTLGKVIYSRLKFRLTVFPGIDHALIVSWLVIFFWGN